MNREQVGRAPRLTENTAAPPPIHNDRDAVGPIRITAQDAWRAVAIGAGALVLAMALLAAIWLLRRPLALLTLGIAVAEAIRPLADRLGRKLPWVLSTVLVFLGIILVLAGLLWLAVPPLVRDARSVMFRLPALLRGAEAWLTQRNIPIDPRVTTAVGDQVGRLTGLLIELPRGIFNSLLELVLVVFISIYWLILTPRTWAFVLSLVPPSRQGRVKQVIGDMGCAMGGYLRGTAIVGAILGVSTYLLLLLIHVHYAAAIGVLTAILEFVPVLGATISMTVLVLVALSQSPSLALIAFVAAAVLHQTEVHILVPNIMAKQTSISPLLAVLAVFAGGTLGGVLGAILAIPLAAALHVFVVDVLAPVVRRRTGALESNPDAG